ncbi:MAG: phosphonate ABC transporter ATP-binding protein [Proteobacteria bacterium]|nr:phosphonate ABC transporter ATP-binding protein [Pseudomonadota bacterium]
MSECEMVRFESVSREFECGPDRCLVALNDVSFTVPRGQFCVIIGPSGSGKSTLLRLINGMLEPTTGSVVFDGDRITEKNIIEIQRRVGTIHQQFELVSRMTVLDNVLSGTMPLVSTLRVLTRLWPKHFQRRACSLLCQVGMSEDQLYRRASQLSGGQQQRVAIARAFILSPSVVLADEPVSSLDPAISRSVLRLLKEASRRSGATVLCSLHQIELAVEFADRVVAIRQGSVAYDGSPERLTRDILDHVYDTAEQDKDATEVAA